MCRHHVLFIHSFASGHLGGFHLPAIVNGAAMNMMYKYVFKTLPSILLDTYPEVGLLGRTVVLVFIFLRKLYTVFHSSCTIVYFHQEGTRVPVPPHPHQHLSFSVSFRFLFYSSHPNRHEVIYSLFLTATQCFMVQKKKKTSINGQFYGAWSSTISNNATINIHV